MPDPLSGMHVFRAVDVNGRDKPGHAAFPWFIALFVLAADLRTVLPQGEPVYALVKQGAVAGLILTLFLIGASLSWNSFDAASATRGEIHQNEFEAKQKIDQHRIVNEYRRASKIQKGTALSGGARGIL